MQVKFSSRRLIGATATAAAVASLSLAAASGASASSLSTVRIAYNPNPTNTALVVAQQQGYFKKNGLNVELTATANTTALLPALGKQVDIDNASPPSILQLAAAHHDIQLIAGDDVESKTERDTYLIANKSITSIKDLKGATIGVPSLSGTLYEAVVVALHKVGISKSQVKFLVVPFPDTAEDLSNGTIQATDTIVPFNGQLLGEGDVDLGNPVMAVTTSRPGLDIGWAATSTWAASHGTQIKEFIKAQEEAVAWIKANPSGTESIIENTFQLPATAAEHLPLYQFFNFSVNKTWLSYWINPMINDGDLPKNFKGNMKALVY
jgi:NitT/TauT family transport system substrate-binding protein